jgi:hypothetical protein
MVDKPLCCLNAHNATVRFMGIIRTVYHASMKRTMGNLLTTIPRDCPNHPETGSCPIDAIDPQETPYRCTTLLWQMRSKPVHHDFAAHNLARTLPYMARVGFTSETCFVLFGA